MKVASSPLVVLTALYGLTFALAATHFQPIQWGAAAALALPLIWISTHDLNHHLIPDTATASVAMIGFAAQYRNSGDGIFIALALAAVLLAGLWLGSEIYWRRTGVEALGLGDVKLLAAATLCLGPIEIWTALFLAAIGGIAASLLASRRKSHLQRAIPFGPFIAYGLYLTFLFAETS